LPATIVCGELSLKTGGVLGVIVTVQEVVLD
jgi:hypothetical protein